MSITIDLKAPIDKESYGEALNSKLCKPVSDLAQVLENAELGRKTSAALSRLQRSSILRRTAQLVEEKSSLFVRLIAFESGKPVKQAKKEVNRCCNTLNLSAEEASRNQGETIAFDTVSGLEDRQGYYDYHPLGIILAITPFNDPLNLIAHKLGPAIAAGNSIILKPSEKAPATALALCQCFYEAGLCENVIQLVMGGVDHVQALLLEKNIRMLSFTGGSKTAEILTRTAGLKKTLMDLGGNAPVIVDKYCELDLAVRESVSGAFFAAGQNCIGVQRIYVHSSIFDKFASAFVECSQQIKLGDPMCESTDMGPMVDEASAIEAKRKVDSALSLGATLLLGNKRDGRYYSPTVLSDVAENHEVYCEEVFAPIAILSSFNELDEVLARANRSEVMLHAAVFSNDLNRAYYLANGIEAAGVMINDSSDFRLDAMPFGGFKYGSLGREGVGFAMREMSQTKVNCIRLISPKP
ncbi:aldehyde dehydrogenase family protein [uncultured Pseudoteredinibacter sp.]|uniref:aldehyde dehydrogenase family protein n=1 Tax=uncultured Pseudoteredinibacter sp. TaxID=1641701 RepID=UPI002615E9C2|nr:aldehyde dehydrogenase family protein [uncultured Pseudoteredinibacter sp.]